MRSTNVVSQSQIGGALARHHEPGSIGGLLQKARLRAEHGTSLEAQLLIASLLDRPRSWVLAHPEYELERDPLYAYQAAMSELAAGTPLPYLLGEWEFYGRIFCVGPAALIPRPETEHLVELGLQWKREAIRVLDLGTGSGCLAVTLACELPRAQVTATDLSRPALRLARANALRHMVLDRVSLVNADLCAPLAGRFDLICANLPYIPTKRLRNQSAVRSEPRMALDGGRRGLRLIRRALARLPGSLAANGLALFEIDPRQAGTVQRLASEMFPAARVRVARDLAGRERVIVIQNGQGTADPQ